MLTQNIIPRVNLQGADAAPASPSSDVRKSLTLAMLCKLMPKQDKTSPFAPQSVARSHRRTLSLDQEAAKPARQSAATASAHPHSEATRQCGPDTAKMATGRQRQEARLPRSRLGDLQPAQDNAASSQQQYSKGSNTTNQNAQQASGTPVSSHPLTEGASTLRDAPQRLKGIIFCIACLLTLETCASLWVQHPPGQCFISLVPVQAGGWMMPRRRLRAPG